MDQHELTVTIEPLRKRIKYENIQEEVRKVQRKYSVKRKSKYTDNTHDRKLKKRILNKKGTKREHSTEHWLEINGKNHKSQKKQNENKKYKRKKSKYKNIHKVLRNCKQIYNVIPTGKTTRPYGRPKRKIWHSYIWQ